MPEFAAAAYSGARRAPPQMGGIDEAALDR
jgi:hypothetical protein